MDQRIDVVITMGGLGSRFRKMGYTVPKYMIEAKGRSLFEWSMISLTGYKDHVNQYIFIAMADKSNDIHGFIEEKCAQIGIEKYKIILLELWLSQTVNWFLGFVLKHKFWMRLEFVTILWERQMKIHSQLDNR